LARHGKKRIRFGSRGKKIEDFVDPNKDPHSYLKRFILEENYRDWFNRNYPNSTIYDAVGLNEWEYNEMEKNLSPDQDTIHGTAKNEPEPEPKIEENDLKVKVLSHKIIKSEVDFEIRKAVVSFGRGIKDAPDENIKLVVELAKQLDAEVGISLPISKKLLSASQAISSTYMIPARVIGTSGSKISPMLYVAAGISGAMQHVAGMQDSEFVVAINPDEDSPIKNECDVFIKGRMEDVIPLLVEELKKQQQVVQAG